MTKKREKKPCDQCGKKCFALWKSKGRMLCYYCYRREKTIINPPMCKPYHSLQEVLDKIYRPTISKSKGSFTCNLALPQVTAGHKFRLVLADNE